MIRRWWRFSERLACLPPVCVQRTGRRPARRRQGGGASIFQDLDLGEARPGEAELRPTDPHSDRTDQIDERDGTDQTDGTDQRPP